MIAHCRPAYCIKPDEQSAVELAITEEQECAAKHAKQLAPTSKTAELILGEVAMACESATMKVLRLQSVKCDPPANFADSRQGRRAGVRAESFGPDHCVQGTELPPI